MIDSISSFGTQWLVLLAPLTLTVGGTALLWQLGTARTPLLRLAAGATRLTGLPGWSALPVAATGGVVLPIAMLGFCWDVAWHVDKGRDEFLFSPPHIALLWGLAGLIVAGAMGIAVATAVHAPHQWRVGRWHVPFGAAALLFAGLSSQVGYFVDEIWHWAYGLDVSMWGPTHITMISAASLSGFAVLNLIASAGPTVNSQPMVRLLRGSSVVLILIGLSAYQLEFDLGVTQWQALFHPVLLALAAAFALTIARATLGPGHALGVALVAAAIKLLFSVTTVGLGLIQPRFPIYLASAVAVEVAFALRGRWSTVRIGAFSGLLVGTLGLLGDALWTQVWSYQPWSWNLVPGVWVAVVVAVAAAILGVAVGRVTTYQPSGLRAGAVVLCLVGLALGLIVPLPRHVPEASAVIRATPAGIGRVNVEVVLDPPTLADGRDRFELFSWQGKARKEQTQLVRKGAGSYRAERPVPVGGSWKTILRYSDHDRIGGIPVYMPADAEIGAAEVPVLAERRSPFLRDDRLLQREAHDGARWPAVVAYCWVLLSCGALIALHLAGFVALDRRRRAAVWGAMPASPLAGKRVVVTGAASGIGAATVAALRAHGASVVGIDRVAADGIVVGDVTKPAAVTAAIEEAVHRLGGIDVLVNNAGIGTAWDSGAMPDADARRTVEVNFFGVWHMTAAALPHLLESGGQVVNISSGLGRVTLPYTAAYSASKRGVLAYGEALAVEYTGRLRVSAVLPGYVKTPIHDGPAAHGLSLEGLVPDEPVEGVVAAVVAAIETGRREICSSPQLDLALRSPRLAARGISMMVRRMRATRPEPDFIRFPTDESRGDKRPVKLTR